MTVNTEIACCFTKNKSIRHGSFLYTQRIMHVSHKIIEPLIPGFFVVSLKKGVRYGSFLYTQRQYFIE